MGRGGAALLSASITSARGSGAGTWRRLQAHSRTGSRWLNPRQTRRRRSRGEIINLVILHLIEGESLGVKLHRRLG